MKQILRQKTAEH